MRKGLLIIFLIFGIMLSYSNWSYGEAYGIKEIVIDSFNNFNHDTNSSLIYFKGKGNPYTEPTGYFADKADLSDPNLMLTSNVEEGIDKLNGTSKLVLPGDPKWAANDKNVVSPPFVGQLRMSGWDFSTNEAGLVDHDNSIQQDKWNKWSLMTPDPSVYTNDRPSLPIGGLNYILQSFKVYRTGQLSKIQLKVRRHPGVSSGVAHGLYVTILADEGDGKNPKRYTSGGEWKDVVLGYAKMEDSALSTSSSDSSGGTSFENVMVVFKGVERPMLVAGKLYWMKISTIPYKR